MLTACEYQKVDAVHYLVGRSDVDVSDFVVESSDEGERTGEMVCKLLQVNSVQACTCTIYMFFLYQRIVVLSKAYKRREGMQLHYLVT